MTFQIDNRSEEQITQCLNLLKDVLKEDLLGMHLYGSSIIGGLQKYSDIDLFVVINRSTTDKEKAKLITALLKISGVYMKSTKRPIEMILIVKSDINPWHYPPKFDFQYGDWLREIFESGDTEPWQTKEMPDLAILITQVLLANKKIFGVNPELLLCKVPYQDFIEATSTGLRDLIADIDWDTRNVLLTLARVWSTIKTNQIRSKPNAATWTINRLPEHYKHVMKRAKAICIGEENEHWDDIKPYVQSCAELILSQINKQIALLKLSHYADISISYAE